MKKVIKNEELQNKMEESIELLCDTVKTTLGPTGNNVIIDKSTFTPFITNDGVTIAKCIESDDEAVNSILEIAKEAAIKTDDMVGDGTTTTLVLLEEIFKQGLELIKQGKKPILLKNEINETLQKIIPFINEKSRKPSKNECMQIATISANDKEIGQIISNVYLKIKEKQAIKLIESELKNTKSIFYKGYSFETNVASSYYFNEEKQLKLEQSHILLVNNYLDTPDEISLILNFIIEQDKELIIMANDYSDLFINYIISLYLDKEAKIYLLKNPEYGENQKMLLKDLSVIANCEVLNNFHKLQFKNLGKLNSVLLNKEKTTFHFSLTPEIKKHIQELKKLLIKSNNNLEDDFNKKRVSMFQNGLAEIQIGGNTKTEIREKIMRYQDALCAIDVASNGIVPGSGITLLHASQKLDIHTDGDKIIKKALKKPFIQILQNAGINDQEIWKEIQKNNFQILYNINKHSFEDIKKTSVLDPTEVIINSLSNACSIASMLLTTTSLIINEYPNNIHKQSEYNEL